MGENQSIQNFAVHACIDDVRQAEESAKVEPRVLVHQTIESGELIMCCCGKIQAASCSSVSQTLLWRKTSEWFRFHLVYGLSECDGQVLVGMRNAAMDPQHELTSQVCDSCNACHVRLTKRERRERRESIKRSTYEASILIILTHHTHNRAHTIFEIIQATLTLTFIHSTFHTNYFEPIKILTPDA